MKKLFVLALAVAMVVVFSMPASAVENKFGGFFDVSFFTYKHLNYADTASLDDTSVRSRTRLYYTAKLHDKLSFINKFEMDTEFGAQATGYGDLGADGIAVEVKNSYADFMLGQYRFEVGVQDFNLLRKLIMADDAAGVKISYRGMDGIIPAFYWFRVNSGFNANADPGADVDQYTLLANIKRGNMQFVPLISYMKSNSGGVYGAAAVSAGGNPTIAGDPLDVYWLALDFNAKFDMWNLALAGGYQGGSLSDSVDITAYMFNAKADVKLANFKIYGEFLYTSGEDSTGGTDDYEGWWYPEQSGTGANYGTAEFVRKGKEWANVPNTPVGGTPGNGLENRMEFGLGAVFNLTKATSLNLAWWNLNLSNEDINGNRDIGNELDAVMTWNMMKNAKLDLIFAYLITGDAVKPATNDASFAYEGAAVFSLSY
jgi:hypothetical protein